MRKVRYISLGLMLSMTLCIGSVAQAQIRIIPQSKIDSIKTPTTVAVRAMEFKGGNNLSFGTIAEKDGVWSQSIEWKNIADQPLVVTRVSSSCSCLRVEVDRTPVNSGAKGSVTLRYDPRNRSGKVSQRAMIYTNLSDKLPTAVLSLEGEVRPKADRRDDYPYLRGGLALRQDTILMHRGEEINVACMNVGNQPLRLAADTLLSSRGLVMQTQPRELKAGEEGDMVIKYTPTTNAEQKVLRLYIGGLQLPPRQRCLIIQVE